MASTVILSCRWDWCRSSFPSIDALDTHVKHEHIWPMKPMRKADIALMRIMDLQSLHSSLNTESSIISGGISSPSTVPPTSIIPQTHERPENDDFNTFTQLSSPAQTHSPKQLPVSPALEGLVRQDGHSGLSAAVEMFERTHGHKTGQHLRLPCHQRSPTHRPLSSSSGSSQEVVEQQLTQEDNVGSQLLLPSEPQIEDIVDTELRWPTDDESDELASEEIRNSEQLVSKQNHPLASNPDSTRGQNFRCGSLNVPLDISASPPSSSEAERSHSQSQPFVLQTQAPYFSP